MGSPSSKEQTDHWGTVTAKLKQWVSTNNERRGLVAAMFCSRRWDNWVELLRQKLIIAELRLLGLLGLLVFCCVGV